MPPGVAASATTCSAVVIQTSRSLLTCSAGQPSTVSSGVSLIALLLLSRRRADPRKAGVTPPSRTRHADAGTRDPLFSLAPAPGSGLRSARGATHRSRRRSEEHTSELQSRQYLVCRLL